MSSFKKSNSYTWILNDGRKSFEEKKKLLNEQSVSKSSDYKEITRPTQLKDKNDYRKFCRGVFKNRDFISQKEFHAHIKSKFNGNVTWYRKRMIALGLITEKNKLIKPNYEKER